MGERAKKKRAADAKAARNAKKAAEKAQAAQPMEGPASTDPAGSSSDNDPPSGIRSSAGKKTGAALPAPRVPSSATKPAPRVPSSSAKQAAQSQAVGSSASTDRTSSFKKLPTKNSKKTGTAAAHVASFASTRSSTRSLVVSSTLDSGKKHTSANDESKVTRPERSATVAARALLEQLQYNETEDSDFEEDPQADNGSNDESETDMVIELDDNDDVAIGNDDDGSSDGDGDGSDIEVVEVGNLKKKQGRVAPAKATRKDLPNTNDSEKESGSDDSDSEDGESACWTRPHSGNWSILTETFEMTFEINDTARGARKNLTLSSLTSWADLQDQVSRVLNVYQGTLQLQYRFSNEKNNSLPFDLRSHDDYDEMRDQLRPLIVPRILANGKRSKSVRKLVVVQLFNRGMEGVSGEKGVKVSDHVASIAGDLSILYFHRSHWQNLPPATSVLPQISKTNFLRRRKQLLNSSQSIGDATFTHSRTSRTCAGSRRINGHMEIAIP